ncbi:hypothetical protein [Leifsonia poae]|uniref:hypothetical protein n=1 Tax=Leifsonia poae TaxID=110933 RepID=UPI001CBF9CF2|nr:hypothetical protein [Leifsonia poae]
MSTTDSAPRTTADIDDEHGTLVRSLSAVLPGQLGKIIATVVVLVSLVFFVWSLIATWSGNADSFLPLFQVFVAGTVVSLNALYANKTFSYVVTLIGAVLWLWVSVTPFQPFFQVLFQALTVTIMIAGVVFSLAAVEQSKKPRF